MSKIVINRLLKKEDCYLSLNKQFLLSVSPLEIIQGFKTLKILNIEKFNDEIVINGLVNIHISFITKGMEQGRHTFSMPLDLCHICSLKGFQGEIYPKITGAIEKVSIEIKDNSKINVNVKAALKINIFTIEEQYLVTGDLDEFQGKRIQVSMNEVTSYQNIAFSTREFINLPKFKPLIKKVCDVTGELYITEKLIYREQAIIKGFIKIDVIYEGAKGKQPLEHFSYFQDFTKNIREGNHPEGLLINVDYQIPNIKVVDFSDRGLTVISQADIRVYFSKLKDVRVYAKLPKEVKEIKDICLLTEYPISRKNEDLYIDHIFTLNESEPHISEIIKSNVRHCYISGTTFRGDNIYIKGRVNLQLEYLGIGEENKVNYRDFYIDFSKVQNIENIESQHSIEVNAIVRDKKIQIVHNGSRIKVFLGIKLNTRCSKIVETSILVEEKQETLNIN